MTSLTFSLYCFQKYFYRYSKSRAKAEYFEGRDDSGVVSQRFYSEPGANEEYKNVAHSHLLDNCLALGTRQRSSTGPGTLWHDWFGSTDDRCRILFTINTVGAGRGTTMLWETNPPVPHAEGPTPWMSEQETAADKIQRNLEEIDAMCETNLIAARVQILVCEPIPDKWTEWMDSLLPHCGGKPWDGSNKLKDRPSPLQVVVAGSAKTADTCHDLKSGFMEKRMQDLVLAPSNSGSKSTHPDLISSDDFDLYASYKWSSLITIRSVASFLQASADLATAASSPVRTASVEGPSSPFLIPSFVRVSYVSEENNKIAKWRMHGDFFHPAAWEISKDSFEMTWIPHSLSGAGGATGLCYGDMASKTRHLGQGDDCGQWWAYMTELQMPTSPEVYANEVTPAPVQGGSNHVWMMTEQQRKNLSKALSCNNDKKEDKKDCPALPQGVIPLGDLESFLVNYMPNTALGKKHVGGRQPGYSQAAERKSERKRVQERKQLQDQEEIEKALFDYTIYPAALFHKDATIKAARARDQALTKDRDPKILGPQSVKSSYYDVTIMKPRGPLLGWCQAAARKGLCSLYADYFRTSDDTRCQEACGMSKDFSPIA